MKIYVTDEDMSFDIYCKKVQQFMRGLVKTDERIKEWKNQWELQRKWSAFKFKKKTIITITAVAQEATKSMLVNIICYMCNKKRHLARDCSDKSKKVETKAVDSDHSDSENELL